MAEASAVLLQPPIAERRDHSVVFGVVEGQARGAKAFAPRQKNDPWFWLRDDTRKSEEVLEHLRRENAYGEQELAGLAGLRQTLYDEHISHLKETDDQAPYRQGQFFYYSRTVKGLAYKIHCRKPVTGTERVPAADASEEVLLDENVIGEGKAHCNITSVKVSPNGSLLMYAADFSGNEVYELIVKDLTTGTDLPDKIENIDSSAHWGDDSTVFYLTKDAALRPYRLWRHKLGSDVALDVMLFEEADDMFYFHAGKSTSNRFIFAVSSSNETTEFQFIDLEAEGASEAKLSPIQPRIFGLRYDLDHDGRDGFLIWTNHDNAINNRLMHAPVVNPALSEWREVIPYDPSRWIEDVSVFKEHVVLEGRQGGLTQIWLLDMDAGCVNPDSLRCVTFDEELFTVSTSVNKDFDTHFVRITYSSLTTPNRWLDLDMRVGADPRETLIKEQPILNFDRTLYVCKRMFATAPDKTQIPMSLVHRRDLYDDDNESPTPKPMMLYGYGSYGICMDPSFNRLILPYLDRGMIYCIAHIRGGGEMGRYWYEEQGKYLTKRNTFQDFVSCAEHLVDKGITAPNLLSAEGRSAGGLLMGNVVNMRPDLFEVIVTGVPFVDLMTTMCDPTIPLTCGEWEEWGNPNEDKYFDYMLSYSPYDNVRAQPYPHILITAGLHDPRVAYWEPAKWASKIRFFKTNSTHVIVKMDLDSGHFSASDRYKYLREKAYDQAFILAKLGLADTPKK